MPDTGAPWNIPYVATSDLVKDWPADNQQQVEDIAAALSIVYQVVGVTTVVKPDTFTTTSATFVTVTDLTLTITPESASSRFFIIASVPASSPAGSSSGKISLFRDGTNLSTPTSPGNRIATMQTVYQTGFAEMVPASLLYLDAPATASAVTYDVRVTGNGDTVHVNRSRQDDNTTAYSRAVATLTVVELAA